MESLKTEEPVVSYEALNLSKTYTYWDYIKWQFAERVELIKGKVFKMSPAPLRLHQKVLMKIAVTIHSDVTPNGCEVYSSPFDVRLHIADGKTDTTVVQPDICVICDLTKLDERGCNGAPDLIVEIVSPSNAAHDTVTKFELYESAGVKEYWIVQPETRHIFVYTLFEGKYIGLPPSTIGHDLRSRLFPKLIIAMNDLFEE